MNLDRSMEIGYPVTSMAKQRFEKTRKTFRVHNGYFKVKEKYLCSTGYEPTTGYFKVKEKYVLLLHAIYFQSYDVLVSASVKEKLLSLVNRSLF